MRLLAIETATPASSVALADDRQVVAYAERVDRKGHASFLVPALDFCFAQASWSPADLDAVIVDIGPGLYTGIRVGVATAQALAAAAGIPLIPAVSLDALAYRAATGRRHIYAVIDVRRGEVAIANYQPLPGGVIRETQPEIVTPDRLRALLESDPADCLVVGDVDALPSGVLLGLHRCRVGRPRFPSADALVEISATAVEKAAFGDEVRPLYLREPDVNINWELLRTEGPWPA